MCDRCPTGTYAARAGQAGCDACPRSSFGSSIGATSPTACRKCQAGHSTAATGSKHQHACQPCVAGTYRSAEMGECAACPANTWSGKQAARQASDCRGCPEAYPYSDPGSGNEEACGSVPWRLLKPVSAGVTLAMVALLICTRRQHSGRDLASEDEMSKLFAPRTASHFPMHAHAL